MSANAASRLLDHYRVHARALPWRAMPGEPRMDPYRVWLSEVMLQQTTVATVMPRFTRFIDRWPTVEALAAADDAEVLHEWAGLGYYARARNLIACARAVVALGAFPQDEAGLRALPGVGAYTAAAVAAIAFGQRSVVIDTNVERVIARLHAIDRPVSEARPQMRELAGALTPTNSPGDHAQAMMDLGATICRPTAPRCGECPIASDCAAFASGRPDAFPRKAKRRERPVRYGTAYWTERAGAVWLVRRPARGLLGSMPALPSDDWHGVTAASPLAVVSHGFTHFTLHLSIIEARSPEGDGWWHPIDELASAGLPTLFRNAVDVVLAKRVFAHAA